MKNIVRLKSIDAPELDLYVGNREVHLLRYFEPEPGLFIAETKNVMDIALKKGFEPVSVVCTEKMLDDEILDRVGDVPIYVVDADEARKRFGYVLTGGITAAMRRKSNADYREIIRGARRILVMEDVENPTNIGAIFRSAAALGIDAVVLSPACVDPLYRRAIRVSVGNVFLVPWAFACRSEKEWKEAGIRTLQEEGFKVMAMALRDDNIDLDDPVLKQEEKLAILLGNEGNGLPKESVDKCDYVVRIPMMNQVDSLNVSVAASIAMWELRSIHA